MIPFDANALLVMLLTFYPIVGPASLQRARAERPDYFAGGEIRGTKGDKLWLSDGRKYDLIFATGSPQQHWQVLGPLPDDGAGAADDPFALQDGPVSPFDLSAFLPLDNEPIFTPLVAGALADLGGHDTALQVAHDALVDAAQQAIAIANGDDGIDQADGALPQSRALVDLADPSDILARSNDHGGVINAREASFPDAPADGFDPNPPALPSFPPDVQQPAPIDTE